MIYEDSSPVTHEGSVKPGSVKPSTMNQEVRNCKTCDMKFYSEFEYCGYCRKR